MAAEQDKAGLPGISLIDTVLSGDRVARPWSYRLVLMVRGLAVFELLKGLAYWAALIGAGGSPDPLSGMTTPWLVACLFFAVADPVAAVGLWLGAAWGVAIWLLAAIGQIVVASVEPAASGGRWFMTAFTLLAMAAYIFLSMNARREAP
ncbi:MAG TPA: DUF6163 family protein [Hansschlegelia sp.]